MCFSEYAEIVYFTSMKTLYLIRHAKSSWAIDGIEDRDRPLKGRGIRDAHLVSQYLRDETISADYFSIYSSPATRALHTALIFAKNLGVPASKVAIDDDLYHSSAYEILEVVKKTPDVCDAAMYFVHNPGITDFVNEMTNASVRNVPTTGVICVRFDCLHWSEVCPGAELIQFEYPKRIKE